MLEIKQEPGFRSNSASPRLPEYHSDNSDHPSRNIIHAMQHQNYGYNPYIHQQLQQSVNPRPIPQLKCSLRKHKSD